MEILQVKQQNEDVTNIDSIGVITARDGLRVTGIATATAFHGDGSALTGVGSAEIYGFTGIGSNLQVRTTGGGADNITGDQYAAFEEVFFASTGISFSINTSGNLIATI